jgi:hypothetical protein
MGKWQPSLIYIIPLYPANGEGQGGKDKRGNAYTMKGIKEIQS